MDFAGFPAKEHIASTHHLVLGFTGNKKTVCDPYRLKQYRFFVTEHTRWGLYRPFQLCMLA